MTECRLRKAKTVIRDIGLKRKLGAMKSHETGGYVDAIKLVRKDYPTSLFLLALETRHRLPNLLRLRFPSAVKNVIMTGEMTNRRTTAIGKKYFRISVNKL
ncbi:hypothetical protein AB6A40_010877 [Gnathostoma spinigerum]|uniref:Uncharacterized protein n=1 Tax=Gnathostoma spinigerum TaxID=75299 RepID=A0ABD6EWM5_9BILA